MSNPRAANGSGKSMFEQTCSLLRNYVKEKGPLPLPPDFTFAHKPPSIMELPTNEASPSPMTIFYGGQVIVLNVPDSKAEEVMCLASKASSNVPADSTPAVLHLDSTGRPSIDTATCNGASRFQAARLSHQPIVADLSIKRKASLSLFLEKRKNRINARAPYNIKGEETSKSANERPWLELAAPSPNNS